MQGDNEFAETYSAEQADTADNSDAQSRRFGGMMNNSIETLVRSMSGRNRSATEHKVAKSRLIAGLRD